MMKKLFGKKTHEEDDVFKFSNISVVPNSITKTKANVLVCPVCGDSGDPSKSGHVMIEFLNDGGDDLRKAYLESRDIVLRGEILIVPACSKLKTFCDYVFFMHLREYSKSRQSLEYMTDSIERCLFQVKTLGLTSIAFNTIGCGQLNYKYTAVVQCFKHAVTSSGDGLQVLIAGMPDMYLSFKQHFPSEMGYIREKAVSGPIDREIPVVNSSFFVPEYWTMRGGVIKDQIFTNEHRLSPLSSSSPVYREVKKIMQDTQASGYVSLGVKAISCVENPALLKKYEQAKEPFKFKKVNTGPYPSLQEQPLTSSVMGPILSRNLSPDINEFYLFHGTASSNKVGIARTGLDIRLGDINGYYGAGVYFAESPTKSNAYTDSLDDSAKAKSKPDDVYNMFLCRVIIGNPYNTNMKREFRRPPCKNGCPIDTCSRADHFPHFDSVLASVNKRKKLPFREFVVYDQHRCYPEFLIEYERL